MALIRSNFKIYLIIFLIFFIFVSCEKRDTKTQGQTKKISIVTSLFPLYDFAREIAKDRANIIMLLPPGMEPHSFDPRPSDIAALHNADVFVYTNIYMEPWVEDILKGISNQNLLNIDSSTGINFLKEQDHRSHDTKHKHGSLDPHIWLDFSNARIMIDNISEGLIKKDPNNADFYRNNAEQYKTRLAALDDKFKKSLTFCKKDIFISGGHLSFAYLAKRYNLRYISAYDSLSPEAEPKPKSLARIIATIKQHGLRHIFYEELITPRIAETISKETDVSLLMLHAAHNISKNEFTSGATFTSLMEKNLQNLMVALQCQ